MDDAHRQCPLMPSEGWNCRKLGLGVTGEYNTSRPGRVRQGNGQDHLQEERSYPDLAC
jgi:hypothetical protein